MDGEIRRGEVYWVTVDDSVGDEIQTGRPAVVLSGNGANAGSNTVIVAFMTSSGAGKWSRVRVWLDGSYSQVCCDQIRTVDKSRLTSKKGFLSAEDMGRVTGAVANALCVPISSGERVVPKKDSEGLEKLTLERDMYKRMYEMVMDAFVKVRVTDAIEERTRAELESEAYFGSESVEKPEEKPEEEPEEEEPEEEPEKPDINTCTKTELVKLGISKTAAHSIVANRPYKSVSDLRTVPGVTKVAYRLIKGKVCCVVEPEKVELPKLNLNTCTAKEIVDVLGVSKVYAYSLTGYRNRNGKYVSVEEVADVPHLPKNFLERFRDRLTVGEDQNND